MRWAFTPPVVFLTTVFAHGRRHGYPQDWWHMPALWTEAFDALQQELSDGQES